MRRPFAIACLVIAASGCVPAWAGSCGRAVAQFAASAHKSPAYPYAGVTGPQTVGAQTGQQPTPASVARARQKARAAFEAVLARAKALDAAGRGAACRKALARARLMFERQ